MTTVTRHLSPAEIYAGNHCDRFTAQIEQALRDGFVNGLRLAVAEIIERAYAAGFDDGQEFALEAPND